jgi:hypothetical protein
MVCVRHTQGPVDYSSTGYSVDPPLTTDKPSWPVLVIVGVLCVAMALLIAHFSLDDKTAATPDGGPAAMAGSKLASGPGWTMRVPHTWAVLTLPTAGVDAAWSIDGNSDPESGVVMVTHRVGKQAASLRAYAKAAAPRLAATLSNGTVTAVRVDDGHAEIEYTGANAGVSIHAIGFVAPTRHGFAVATLTSSQARFGRDVESARPFLATLDAR